MYVALLQVGGAVYLQDVALFTGDSCIFDRNKAWSVRFFLCLYFRAPDVKKNRCEKKTM